MRRFVVHQHRQLCARNGDLVAGGGESVSADHPAVLELADPASTGRFVDDGPTPPTTLAYVPPAPELLADPDDAQAETPPRKTRGRGSD